MAKRAVTFVVMAGGKGERLWPLVRVSRPKVCLSPDGTRTLLQQTIARLRAAWPGARWLIVTTAGQAKAVRESLPRPLRRCVFVEPRITSTGACLTLAAVAVAARDPSTVMVAAPADHWMTRSGEGAYRLAIRAAIHAAADGRTIATIGIPATQPHPGFGYLCAGASVNGVASPRVLRLTRFIEKPSRAKAAQLLKRPRTYWNSGTFIGTAEVFLERITERLPEHARRLWPLRTSIGTPAFARAAAKAYRGLAPVSFDHGVMNALRDGLVVEGRFAWADLGSWDLWARLGRSTSPVVTVDSRNVTVVSRTPHLVATIGMRNMLVVHTEDATLICPPERSQAVRGVVTQLSRDRRLRRYL